MNIGIRTSFKDFDLFFNTPGTGFMDDFYILGVVHKLLFCSGFWILNRCEDDFDIVLSRVSF